MVTTRSKENLIISIGLLTLVMIYAVISKKQIQDSRKYQNKILENTLIYIVNPDKSKEDSQLSQKSNIKKHANDVKEPFMLDASDYRPFQLDGLLDPNDRTVESERAKFNYNNLLEITHSLNALDNNTLRLDDIKIG